MWLARTAQPTYRMHPVIHERKEAAGSTQMGNAEETNELIGKTGSGNTLDSAAKDVAAVERSLSSSREREASWVRRGQISDVKAEKSSSDLHFTFFAVGSF